MMTALAAGLAVLLMVRPGAPLSSGASLRLGGVVASAALLIELVVHQRPPVVLLLIVGVGGAAVARQLRRRRAAAAASLRSSAVLQTCEGLAADLAAGLPPQRALVAAARQWPEFAPVAHAARLGADVPAALRDLASLPGSAPLNQMAAAWSVANSSGAGLASAMSLAADALREDRALARTIATELAAALATARLLAVLPLPVLLIGRGAGGDPFAFLFGTSSGVACLAIGLLLVWSGTVWLDRIADGIRDS